MRKSSEADGFQRISSNNVGERPAHHSVGGVLTSRQLTIIPFPRAAPQIRILDTLSCKFPVFDGCPEWAKPFMYAEHQAGFPEAWLCSLVRYLPSDLAVALRGAVLSHLILEKYTEVLHQRQMKHNSVREDHALLVHRSQVDPARVEPWLYEPFGGSDDELFIFDRASKAISRQTFVPSTRRRTEYYANPSLCRIVGLSVEELLSRVGAADLPEHMSPLDHLCGMIESVMCSLDNSWVDVVRWKWPGRPAMLVERTTRNSFNRQGLCWQRLAYHRVLSPDEYDARYAAADADRDIWGGLRRAIGDVRSGMALLADAEFDRQKSIEDLVGTPAGRETLSRLAEEVRRRCDDRTRAARRVLDEYPEVEAWARTCLALPWKPISRLPLSCE